jgi:hypothetical protein
MFMKKDTQIPTLRAYRSTRLANLRQRSRAVDVAIGVRRDTSAMSESRSAFPVTATK